MRKNKRKNRRKRIFKVCVALILFEIIMIFGIIYYYVDQAPITQYNSIKITGTPENIEMLHLRQATHLYFTLNGEQYRVSGEFAEDPDVWVNQFQAEDKITAIVKNKLDFPHRSRFAVDLRSESTVYCNIEDYNKEVKFNRVVGCVVLAVVWLIGTALFVLKLSIL